MSLSIGVGGDIEYYERGADNEHVQESEPHHDVHAERARSADYYTGDVEAGRELEGRWIGPGAEALGLTGNVTSWQLHKLYGEHTDPTTLIELGSRPRKFTTPAERLAARLAKEPFATEARKAEITLSVSPKTPHTRNFLDLTFSVPKSYSVLFAALTAAGRDDDAAKLMDAHHRAIDECMKVLMAEAGYSRTGHHGRKVAGISTGERIDAHGFVYSIFDHRLSRCGDPQVHSHVLLLNKVECADGQWRTLDTDAIVRQMQRSVGALHERFLAEETARTMGLSHRPRLDGFGWEVEGIEQADMDLYSSRRRAIDPVAEEMTAKFVAKFNREPNARERDSIQQAATLATRPAKPHDMTFEQYVEQWMDRYATERNEHLAELLDRVPMGEGHDVVPHSTWDRSEVLKMAVARCEAKYPTWGRPQLRQALSDLLPPNLGRTSSDELVPYLDSLINEAIGSERIVVLSQPAAVDAPESLRHENGHSIYEPFHVERFTTQRRLTDEGRLAGLAQRTDGPRLTDQDAHRLIIETTLHPDQARVAHNVLTSGRRLTFMEAKAGTGKSYTIGKVAQLWDFGMGGRVIGLAKSQAATGVLIDEGLTRAYNFAQFRTAHEHLDVGSPGYKTSVERYGVTPHSLLIVDEVSTLDDADRFWLESFARENDITMFWVGDRGQVGAVGADGGLDVLASAMQPLELDVARRFVNEWEGPASLDLHDGKCSAIIDYDAHGRVVTGTREEINAKIVNQLVADLTEARNALLMVPSNELAAEFSSEVRQRLIDIGQVDDSDAVALRDQTHASAGDVVQARETTKQIAGAQEGEAISNRDVFRVERILPDRSLVVRQHLGHDGGPVLGPERVLPAAYVKQNVELAYATTVDSKIGRTVENGYELVTNASDWNDIYTGATRGKFTNVLFVPVEHKDGVAVETGVEVLARIAERASVELSATEAQRQELEAVTHLGRLGPIYDNELAKHARQDQRDLFERVLAPEYAAALATDETAPALYRLTHALEREGRDVEQLVRAAIDRRELGSADSIGQVLHWRIARAAGPVSPRDVTTGTSRYVDAVPAGDTPELNYLRQTAQRMDERAALLGQAQTEAPDLWATNHLGQVPSDPAERARWVDRAAQIAAYREHYGVTEPHNAIGEAPGRSAAEQRAAWEGAYVALGRPAANEDVARLSDGELLLNVDQYKRVESWMPPEVSERLKATSTAARDFSTEAAISRAKGDIEAAERAERMAVRMTESAAKFEAVNTARRLAEEFSAPEREQANASQRELERRRGIDDPQAPEVHDAERDAQPQQRSSTIDDALDRARQVTLEIEAERAVQEEQRRVEHEQHRQDHSNEHGYGY